MLHSSVCVRYIVRDNCIRMLGAMILHVLDGFLHRVDDLDAEDERQPLLIEVIRPRRLHVVTGITNHWQGVGIGAKLHAALRHPLGRMSEAARGSVPGYDT